LALIGVTLRILVHQLDDLVDKEHDDDDSNNHTDDRADGNGINIHLILLSAWLQARTLLGWRHSARISIKDPAAASQSPSTEPRAR
jgi:hypothetical protein